VSSFAASIAVAQPPESTRDLVPETRVAIVDDDPAVRLLLRAFLRSSPSVTVVTEVDNGADAAQAVADAGADVVIMDYDLGPVDGIEATRAVMAAQPQAHVVVFTASGSEAVAADFRAAGAVDQFDKGELHELIAYVSTLVGVARRGRGR
jgi:DNA-binding NarL/FixJ family response regulator